jgi:hypothetical protein
VETFDQTTAKIVKVVRKQNSGPSGDKELAVEAILASDDGLIDDENDTTGLRNDTYYVMAPVTGNRITGSWSRPPGTDFEIFDIADQQTDPLAVMSATTLAGGRSKPPAFELVVTDVASNKILHVLHAPSQDGVDYPYLVAEDTTTQHAYVPGANSDSQEVFIDFNVITGHVSNNFVAPASSSDVQGLAIDSSTHMMCTTTQQNYSVEMYDLTTRKQTFFGQIPNAGGELQAGSFIAADPLNHLFLVEQPNDELGGSAIYVYNESGKVLETLSGFQFGPGSGIQVVAKNRSGYVAGPNGNQLQSLTY